MNARTQARFEDRARILKALAHPSRLFMVEALGRKERCVCELTGMVGADISTVSRHLALLRAAGIVAVEKRGAQMYYRLRTPCVLRFFDCIGDVIGSARGAVGRCCSVGRRRPGAFCERNEP
jgi:ArsR family transcriptional regulator